MHHSRLLRRIVVALTLSAWLLGGAWHGLMQVRAAAGEEVCTAFGAKRVPGEAPGLPASKAAKDCTLCVAFGAPALASSHSADDVLIISGAGLTRALNGGATVPASHLADLASRAPPRV